MIVGIIMFTVKTGPVRTSGFALKLRRAVNASLREYYKEGKIKPAEVNKAMTEINKALYDLIVSEFGLPKESVVNISIEFDIEEGLFKLKDINIESFVKDEILSKTLTNKAKIKLLQAEKVTA